MITALTVITAVGIVAIYFWLLNLQASVDRLTQKLIDQDEVERWELS